MASVAAAGVALPALATAGARISPQLLALKAPLEEAVAHWERCFEVLHDAQSALREWEKANPSPEIGDWDEDDGRPAKPVIAEYERQLRARGQRKAAAIRAADEDGKLAALNRAAACVDGICEQVEQFEAATLTDLIAKAEYSQSDLGESRISNSIVSDLLAMGEAA